MRLVFDWDTRKAESNLSKHGVSFEEAVTAHTDAEALFVSDDLEPDRFIAIGMSASRRKAMKSVVSSVSALVATCGNSSWLSTGARP